MNTIIHQLTEFLNGISEDMVLYVSNDTFTIEPLHGRDYSWDQVDDTVKVNNHIIYIIEDL